MKGKSKSTTFGKKVKKFLRFLFVEESIQSYIAFLLFLVFLFSLIFYLILPYGFGIVDVVAVVTPSMEHSRNVEDTFYKFFLTRNFSMGEIKSFDFSDGISIGDVVIVKKVNPNEIKVGDVIVFRTQTTKIIHRVIKVEKRGNEIYFTTKGDANPTSLNFEKNITPDRLIGKAIFKIPYLGYPRIILLRVLGI